ncbi:hypothetical protein B0O99DRAFT_302703 [Bisporella sp. PMI_857]|nr:hypothetical protein B0O99DRAFT_302703 [Bisporella sp. PMI_857]
MASQGDRSLPTIIRFRNSLACVPCRSRHVKCDAAKPNCVRCGMDGKACFYMKSRRGMRYKASPPDESETQATVAKSAPAPPLLPKVTSSETTSPALDPSNQPSQVLTPCSATPESHCLLSQKNTACLSNNSSSPSSTSKEPLPKPSKSSLETNLSLYYTFFHNAHPWVVPRARLDRLVQSSRSQIEELLAVMEYVGSTYTAEGQSKFLRQRALNLMLLPFLRKTAFNVQALLILAVAVHSGGDFRQARATLDRAISIALEIGMHFKSYATANARGDPVIEESWRRTWWGIFVVDGCFEAIHRSQTFQTWHIHADVDLPCEELDYAKEDIPPPHTIAEYEERDFADEEIIFSSFAYLIDVLKILGSLMAVVNATGSNPDSIIDDTDSSLLNWKLHLPDSKKDVLRTDGEIDEPLFHAHMYYNVIQVVLHRPRSCLLHSPVENTSQCAPPSPPSHVPPTKQHIYHLSTKKALSAAEAALTIFTLPTPLINHTPLVVCGVALSILASLSACSWVLDGNEYEAARNRIRLGIGTLRVYGRTWPVGQRTLMEIKSIAREVFRMKDERKVAEMAAVDLSFPELEGFDEQSYLGDWQTMEYPSIFDITSIV